MPKPTIHPRKQLPEMHKPMQQNNPTIDQNWYRHINYLQLKKQQTQACDQLIKCQPHYEEINKPDERNIITSTPKEMQEGCIKRLQKIIKFERCLTNSTLLTYNTTEWEKGYHQNKILCDKFIECSQQQQTLHENIKKLNETTKKTHYKHQLIIEQSEKTTTSLTQYYNCVYTSTELREQFNSQKQDINNAFNNLIKYHKKCITSKEALNQTLSLLETLQTEEEPNKTAIYALCNQAQEALMAGWDCYKNPEKYLNKTTTLCEPIMRGDACQNFPNSNFEGDLKYWFPYIQIGDQGFFVNEQHSDFELITNPLKQNQGQCLKITNHAKNNNIRSSIAKTMALNPTQLNRYNLEYKIHNNQTLNGTCAAIYARIQYLGDTTDDILGTYYWYYHDFIDPRLKQYPHTDLGAEKDKNWNTITANLGEKAAESVGPTNISRIQRFRFSTGIINSDKKRDLTMYIDDIRVYCE